LDPNVTTTVDDDAQLVEQILGGDSDRFAALVRRHQSQVFRILYRYERDYHRLEDLAQETFVKAWRSLAQFDRRAPFHHWLARIAVNVALDHLRRFKRQRNEIGIEDISPEARDWVRDPAADSELDSRQAAELLALAMRELSPAEQVVITMQEFEGRSIKEICERTGSSNVAVRVRALRARQKLRRALEKLK
jgi:RNA polymerase sigma-70 factor (ECF subfamily)